MTTVAARLWFCSALQVLRVIKFQVEAFFKTRRKVF